MLLNDICTGNIDCRSNKFGYHHLYKNEYLHIQQRQKLHYKDLQAMFLFVIILQQHQFKSTLLGRSKGNNTADGPITLSSTFINLSTTGPSSLTETVGRTVLATGNSRTTELKQSRQRYTEDLGQLFNEIFSLSLTSGFSAWIAKYSSQLAVFIAIQICSIATFQSTPEEELNTLKILIQPRIATQTTKRGGEGEERAAGELSKYNLTIS